MLKTLHVKDFNLDQIFESGQCFRWFHEPDGSYTIIAFGKILNIRQEPTNQATTNQATTNQETSLELSMTEPLDYENIWHHYFDLDRDYGAIKLKLASNDAVMAEAIEYGQGIRILNQDKWETIISFLISQNNNIPRIKKCIESLCTGFGEYIGEYNGKKYYGIPTPAKLASLSEKDLAECRLGYRAKYIIETAKQVESLGIEDDYRYLNTLCGVGPKVANCILLFSMKKIESFPIDVWVKRVMNKLYGIDEEDTKAMTLYAEEHFGEYGGIAQQYLFYYIRGTHNGDRT